VNSGAKLGLARIGIIFSLGIPEDSLIVAGTEEVGVPLFFVFFHHI
jgi:hypothetical protein